MTSIPDDPGSVFDVIQQPVLALDARHRVFYANPPAAEIMGYDSPSDLLGTLARPVSRPGAPGPTPPPTERGRSVPERGRGTLTRADGSLVRVDWLLLPFSVTRSTAAVYVLRAGAESEGRALGPPALPRALAALEHTRRQWRTADILQQGAMERLAGLLLGLRMARASLGADAGREAVVELLAGAIRDAEEALAHVRQAAVATCPGILRLRGLAAAVTVLAARCPLPVAVTGTLAGRLPDPVELHLYFLVETALERAARDAGATEVRVRLDAGANLVVSVTDDGRAPGRDDGPLAAIADRVSALEGSLEVGHTPGSGTTVRAVVPLPPAPVQPSRMPASPATNRSIPCRDVT